LEDICLDPLPNASLPADPQETQQQRRADSLAFAQELQAATDALEAANAAVSTAEAEVKAARGAEALARKELSGVV
jgi:hypothetical protein